MVKRGPRCDAQRRYLERLVEIAPDLFPRILGSWEGGYALDALCPHEPNATWPIQAERVGNHLWNLPPVVENADWTYFLEKTLGIVAPAWTHEDQSACATHGDMTLCNTLRRASGQIVFTDPVYPERVPQIRHVDCARIVQSMLGWEIMTGFQTSVVSWVPPMFLHPGMPVRHLKVTLFWLSVIMARIGSSLVTTHAEKQWARHLRAEIEGVLPL